jgi:hypothetical protein
MRALAAAIILGLCAAACQTAGDTSAQAGGAVRYVGTWAFDYESGAGVATATLGGSDGRTVVTVACQSPNGPVKITDWTFARDKQGETNVTFTIGTGTTRQPGRVLGTGDGRQALTFTVPGNDPVWRALTPNAAVTTTTLSAPHIFAPGAASRLNDVLNACLQRGS